MTFWEQRRSMINHVSVRNGVTRGEGEQPERGGGHKKGRPAIERLNDAFKHDVFRRKFKGKKSRFCHEMTRA